MAQVEVTLNLPEELVEQAKALGALNDSRVAQLLDIEVKRIQRWQAMQETLAQLQSDTREHFGELSDEEAMALVDTEVKKTRAERRKSSSQNDIQL